jgi:MoCo/4Fe-4S cofactor protein with predicted Tat translocation signal
VNEQEEVMRDEVGPIQFGSGNGFSLPILGQADASPDPIAAGTREAGQREVRAFQDSLDRTSGKQYWRSIEEWTGTPEFESYVKREYPSQVEMIVDPFSRRRFLQLMGASLALAGFSSCAYQPKEEILPYVRQPEEIVAGKPLYFATAMPMSGGAAPLLVRSNDGRPTKIEGNPDHPATLGGTDIFSQASILGLYDPERSQAVTYAGEIHSWSSFIGEIRAALEVEKSKSGQGLRILTEPVVSPTLAKQITDLLKVYPGAKWYQYETQASDGAHYAALDLFGEPVRPIYHFEKAERILSFDADFLASHPKNLRYIKEYAKKRNPDSGTTPSRLYAVETTATLTGGNSDHRIPMKPSEVEMFARAVAGAVGVGAPQEVPEAFAAMIDLKSHEGSGLVIAGDEQSAVVHALAYSMNGALGNVGSTVTFSKPLEVSPVAQLDGLRELVADMQQKKVTTLIILGGNPVYTAPTDLNFASALESVRLRIYHGLYNDETSGYCHWHIPEAHYLESWSDTRAYDGTISIVQPLIAPLYQGRTKHEVLSALTDQSDKTSYEIVKSYWKTQLGSGADAAWRQAVHDGYIKNSALASGSITAKQKSKLLSAPVPAPATSANAFEVNFRLDPTVLDGQFANNGWLQELPKPMTKLTWDNAAFFSPRDARTLHLENAMGSSGGDFEVDVVELELAGRKVKAPAWILPGQPDGVVTLHLGYGRTRAGHVGTATGFNANLIRATSSPWFSTGLIVHGTAERYNMAQTQTHHSMEGWNLVHESTFDEYREHPDYIREEEPPTPRDLSMFPNWEYKGYAWGLVIDLNSCVGCSACTVACQSENNIPVVGKEQVMMSREMHWIRIDRYFTGPGDNPNGSVFQPVPCMHCENAPCEVVCPVGATVHSAEGTNDMVYNRCVGTRYCSNNCPYKVRRFNFLLFNDWNTESLKLSRNPDVTVRSRGIMEKCTYCIQRIQNAKIESEKENRLVRDGEIVTACQSACPADAITFGNINDPNSKVAKLKASKRNYSLLDDLNTRPRTTYLSLLRNPNPALKPTKTEKA